MRWVVNIKEFLIGRTVMKKIVINNCYGGFGLSQEALIELQKSDSRFVNKFESSIGILEEGDLYPSDELKRDNLKLVEIVEQLGSRANDEHAELKIVEIPDNVEYIIEEYDGSEWVAEAHRTWH